MSLQTEGIKTPLRNFLFYWVKINVVSYLSDYYLKCGRLLKKKNVRKKRMTEKENRGKCVESDDTIWKVFFFGGGGDTLQYSIEANNNLVW
jgi:hypothetical protein